MVADLGGAGGGLPGDGTDQAKWVHPMRPAILAERVANYSRIKIAQHEQKKRGKTAAAEDGDAAPPLGDEYAAFDHSGESQWDQLKHWVEVKKEALIQQDPNPLWRNSLIKMEGHFGTGIGSV